MKEKLAWLKALLHLHEAEETPSPQDGGPPSVRVETMTPDGGILYDVVSALESRSAREHIKSILADSEPR